MSNLSLSRLPLTLKTKRVSVYYSLVLIFADLHPAIYFMHICKGLLSSQKRRYGLGKIINRCMNLQLPILWWQEKMSASKLCFEQQRIVVVSNIVVSAVLHYQKSAWVLIFPFHHLILLNKLPISQSCSYFGTFIERHFFKITQF